MATYGKKKKKSILPSFSMLRDSSASSKSKKDISKKRGSTTLAAVRGSQNNDYVTTQHDDSIEEMASMLLDDTTVEQFKPEAGKRLSQMAAANVPPRIPRIGSTDSKELLQLPQLTFNGDETWALNTAPVVTAAGRDNDIQFSAKSAGLELELPRILGHTRQSSAPPIPRKSSKRKSVRPKTTNNQYAEAIPLSNQGDALGSKDLMKGNLTSTKASNNQTRSSPTLAADVNGKIEAMLAATRALKPDADGALLQGPLVPTKKRRLKDSKVIMKMKTAINDRLNSRNSKKRHGPAREDRLLNSPINEVHEFDDELGVSASPSSGLEPPSKDVSSGDILKSETVKRSPCSVEVKRKPVPDDGRSLKSRKSVSDDPFSETPHSSSITRTPTKFESRLRDDMLLDFALGVIPDLPPRAQTLREEFPEPNKATSSPPTYDTDFDALFSSSPLAQSTPRIRLEPTIEEGGKRTQRIVRADSRSMFDQDISGLGYSDMDIDSSSTSNNPDKRLTDSIKRKSPHAKDSGFGFRYHSKKMKKHPSPSKTELEGLVDALKGHSAFGTSETLVLASFETASSPDDVSPGIVSTLPTQTLLAPKDSNAKIEDTEEQTKSADKGKLLGLLPKSDLTKASSTTDTSKRSKTQKSLIPKPAAASIRPRHERDSRRYSSRHDVVNRSAMDIDELQWDTSTFNIGMKKT